MAKSDQKNLRNQSQGEIQKTQQQGDANNNQLQGIVDEARGQKQELYPKVTAGYTDIQAGGGYDPAILGDVRASYQNMIGTGGISEEDATAMRNRAASAAQSTFETGKAEATRKAAVTGGYGDTSGAVAGFLARKGSQAAEEATTASNADIAKIRQAGRLAGTQGLQQTESDVARNKLVATSGLANMYGMTANEVNSTVNNILENYRTTGSLTAAQMAILQNLANQPGVFDKIISTIGTLGGTAAGIMGALP